ncbi:MAG TPA: helix-turn-helix domain-containing protein [Acetobacteraceae bacterium]|nr:helix-turn-helix domain-containing protein [Acetobacteraceae bacterium]
MAITTDMLTANEAARRLGVTQKRVYSLVASGALSARRLGNRFLLDPSEVEARKMQGIVTGRPLDQTSAWAVLWLASARDKRDLGPWGAYLARNTRWRVRQKLGEGPLAAELAALAPRLRRRGRLVHMRAHPSDLPRLLDEPDVVRTGISAAADVGADIVAPADLEAYAPAPRFDELRGRYFLEESNAPNVWLRLIHEPWPFPSGTRVAPAAAVALDLLDSADERTRRAGRELLDAIDQYGRDPT